MASSTDIRRRKSINTISLREEVIRCSKTKVMSYPPVLVPPAKSKTSHGRGSSSSPLSCCIRYMISFSISSGDNPRIPPPSGPQTASDLVVSDYNGRTYRQQPDAALVSSRPLKRHKVRKRREMTASAISSYCRKSETVVSNSMAGLDERWISTSR